MSKVSTQRKNIRNQRFRPSTFKRMSDRHQRLHRSGVRVSQRLEILYKICIFVQIWYSTSDVDSVVFLTTDKTMCLFSFASSNSCSKQ